MSEGHYERVGLNVYRVTHVDPDMQHFGLYEPLTRYRKEQMMSIIEAFAARG
jgi:hypothetical protein